MVDRFFQTPFIIAFSFHFLCIERRNPKGPVKLLTVIEPSIWDWSKSTRLSRFSNANPPGSRINEARFINEDDQALLLTGSSDGIVRIFRNYESESTVELVSAFRALTNLVDSTKNAGLVLDWQQGQGRLLVTGDVKVIRVWKAAREIFEVVRLLISFHDLYLPPDLVST